MMISVLIYIVVVSLFSFGWSNFFNENMIFEGAGKWLDAHVPEWLAKPTYKCPICVSVHAAWIMGVAGIISFTPWWHVPLIAVASSGLCSVLIGFQSRLTDIADVIEDK